MTKTISVHQIEHSAIGSWAGYIYQGICAAIESVRLLINDNDCNYTLYMDVYEDFAILDADGNIVSFHQCKDIKGSPDYTDAFNLMIESKNHYIAQGKASVGSKLFFHCNSSVSPPSGIDLYSFPNGHNYCPPNEIFENLELIVGQYFTKYSISVNSKKVVANSLASLVEKKVLEVQGKFFSPSAEKKLLKDIARRESKIELKEIKDFLNSKSQISIDSSNFLSYTKQEFLRHLVEKNYEELARSIELNQEYQHKEDVNHLLKTIIKMSDSEWNDFLTRITPDIHIAIDELSSIVSLDRMKNLHSLIKKIKCHQILDNLYVHKDGEIEKKSLTTLNDSNEDLSYICRHIYDNRQNLNCIYEVRWLIGLLSSKADNIEDAIKAFTQIDPTDHTSIFNPQKTGLLSEKDLNDGNY
ncbi:ABC-three component system protein [uncultured Fibrobacter sp.]|uniref:ABC-three component system protein n=1 Tax=uncultured Fibrobacter sp. TaxID=261512 RepID=UPI0025CC94A2|nr:ABC-three component system protein [uncultured Fibrobacter sp.]